MDETSKVIDPDSVIDHALKSSTLSDGAGRTRDLTFLGEKQFHHLLRVERKRTERSGNASLSMLIDICNVSGNGGQPETIRKILLLLSSMLRETDIVGWHRSNSVIGVILSEIGDSDPVDAMEMISVKFKKSISKKIGRDMADGIRINFECITKKNHWKNCNSLLKLPAYDSPKAPGRRQGLAWLLKSFLGEGLLLVLVDLLLVSAAQFAGFLCSGEASADVFKVHAGPYWLVIAAYFFSLYIFGLYDVKKVFKYKEIAFRISLSVILPLVASAVGFYLNPPWGCAANTLAIQAGAAWVLLTGWRFLHRKAFQFSNNKIPTLIVGAGGMGKSALQLLTSPHSRFEVAGFLDDDPALLTAGGNGAPPVLGTTGSLVDIVCQKGIKAVVLAMKGNESARVARSILEARLCGRQVYDLPSLYEKIAARIPVNHVEDRWLAFADGFHLISKDYVQKMKRIFDLLWSGALLICSLPLIALTALAIRMDSPGPVFYTQIRIGKRGRPFTLFKFRSMCADAEAHGPQWAQKEDPRITRVGRVIRLLHIDELPQAFNVFMGDMSLVGPRPERPEFVSDLEKQVPYYSVRHVVRPGITGWAQIKYPYGASIEDALRKLEYDLFYIKNMSILLDFRILLRTIGVVIMGRE